MVVILVLVMTLVIVSLLLTTAYTSTVDCVTITLITVLGVMYILRHFSTRLPLVLGVRSPGPVTFVLGAKANSIATLSVSMHIAIACFP